MKARHILALSLGIALMAAPIVALAGVTASVHDLPDFYNYTDAQAKQGACSFCHVPHKAAAGGDRLFPVAYSAGLPAAWSSDSLSNICWYCHGAASGYASAVEVNPFQGGAHKRQTTLLTTRINPASTDPGDIGSVPTDMNLVGTELRCVSCHKIHDNTVKPYLQWGQSGNFSASATGFCGKCHPNRSNTGTFGTAATNHPSNTAFADNTTGDSPVTGAALPAIMQLDMVSLAAPLAGAWNLGGHALWTAGAETNTLVCGTCHAVHNNETATWSAADGGTPVGTAIPSAGTPVLVAKDSATLTTEQSAPICTACHSIAFGIGTRGPGAAGTFSHPVGTMSAWADLMSAAGRGYKWNGSGANDMIVCQSCHDIHWSGTNSSGRGSNNYLLAESCNGCHSVAGTVLASHHPTNISGANALVNGTARAETPAAGNTDWAANTQVNDGVNYWALSNTMTCDTCHGLGGARAHNNPGGFPGLSGRNTESDMCVDCHSFNPSVYTTTQSDNANFSASHWTGGINTVAYKKATSWAATGAQSQYSPDGGANGAVICESCHSLAIVGKTGSPSGHVGSDITAYATALNTGDGVAVTKDTVILLLGNSGNMRGGFTSADNLCTACHGSAPGGGLTHPVLPNYTTNSTMVPGGNATTAAGKAVGQINCESCHRPHDADTQSGTWVLELAAILGTQIDYSSLCGLCHTNQF